MTDIDKIREAAIAWAEIEYRNVDEFSRNDLEIAIKAYAAGRASAPPPAAEPNSNSPEIDGITVPAVQAVGERERQRQRFETVYAQLNRCTPGGGWNDRSAESDHYEEVDVQDAWILWASAVAVQVPPSAEPAPCRNEMINSGAQAWPRSCMRCGLGPCQTGVVPNFAAPQPQEQK